MMIAFNGKGMGTTLSEAPRRKALEGVDIGTFVTVDGFDETAGTKEQHDMEPLKRVEDIEKVTEYLVAHRRYRDNLLFIAGINFGFRISDLVDLKVGHLIDENGNYRDKVSKFEKKTDKKLQKDGTYKEGKVRTVYLNDAVMDAADLYFSQLLKEKKTISLDDWLFGSDCNRCKSENVHITERSAYRIIRQLINDECGIAIRAGTHTLRKTFAYHIIMSAENRERAIEFLQKMFNHSSPSVTLHYAGITDEEIKDAYRSLNLGRGMGRCAGLYRKVM